MYYIKNIKVYALFGFVNNCIGFRHKNVLTVQEIYTSLLIFRRQRVLPIQLAN